MNILLLWVGVLGTSVPGLFPNTLHRVIPNLAKCLSPAANA